MTMTPVGYLALIQDYDLKVIPHFRQSYIASRGRGQTKIHDQREQHIYPKTYALKDPSSPFEQLEFALKYDGLNLEVIKQVFAQLPKESFVQYIKAQPTGKYVRKLWFLYEFLTGDVLGVEDSKRLKYVDLLDAKDYFTGIGQKSARHGIINNLIGNRDFCPIVRRTTNLETCLNKKLDLKAKKITEKYDPSILARASNYLYAKETLSSYEIERERPSKDRLSRFIEALRAADTIKQLSKKDLIELQNMIVDPRFSDVDYRTDQNYVGENVNQYFQRIHFISPRPQDVESLMSGSMETINGAAQDCLHPVILAAVIAFGFVFIHPFEDGNGRIHRFLIHYILAQKQFVPKGIIFPVSAVMVQNIHEYDKVLEFFSKELMKNIKDYTLDDEGVLKVNQDTGHHYQYIDYTIYAEYLFNCIERTLDEHFEKEIQFLINYDKMKSGIKNIVDMPDKQVDLFIRCVLQNQGCLSAKKLDSHFDMLSKHEVQLLEKVVQKYMLSYNENHL